MQFPLVGLLHIIPRLKLSFGVIWCLPLTEVQKRELQAFLLTQSEQIHLLIL
jgi:hypothetical protein